MRATLPPLHSEML